MLRKILGMVVLCALAGCSGLPQECQQDGDCGQGAICRTGVCFFDTPTEVDAGQCELTCAPFEACARNSAGSFECVGRYSELKLLKPDAGSVVGGEAVPLEARLVVKPGLADSYPPQLEYRVARSDGGAAGTVERISADGGTYLARWVTPAEEGEFDVTAAYPADGGPSTTVRVTLDRTGPSLMVTVPAAQPLPSDGGFTHADPASRTAWRRDQVVPVRIESDAQDLEPSSVRVLVRGLNGGANVEDLAVTPVSPCEGRSFCGTVDVPLWRPGLPAFRGTFVVEVTAKDRVGNVTTRTGNIPVTRWKWEFDGAAGTLRASPAVGQLGTVYFGTSDASGKVFALNPEGTKRWERAVGSVLGSPAVGSWSAGTELVYVAGNGLTSTTLYALTNAGDIRHQCSYSPTLLTSPIPVVHSAAAVLTLPLASTSVEAGLFTVTNYGSAVGVRPVEPGSVVMECVPLDGTRNMPGSTASGGLAVENGGSFYYPTDTRRVVKYLYDGTLLQRWSADPSAQSIFGLALVGDQVIASGGVSFDQGGLFSIPREPQQAPGTVSPLPETGSGRIHQFAAAADGTLLFGRETASGQGSLTRYDLATRSTRASQAGAGVFQAAPVVGADERVYTLTSTGEVAAWTVPGLSAQWRLAGLGSAEASLSLDCARDAEGMPLTGRPGILYVPAGGRLHAVVVDSPRLAASGWPKFQHDARNTGNLATPVTNCQ